MKRTTVTGILFAAALCLPVLMLGAVHPVTLGIALAIAAGLHVMLATGRSVRLDLPGILLLVLVAATLLQLIPLPTAVVRVLSPSAASLREAAQDAIGLPTPGFMPLTIDTTATLVELARLVLYLAVYWTAAKWVRHHDSVDILRLVAFIGAVAAAILLAHKIFLFDSVYGFYNPLHKGLQGDRVSAPLINENHMAAFLCLCTTVTIGLAVSSSSRGNRLGLIATAAITGGALLLTLSRGGIAAFVAAQILFVAILLARRVSAKEGDSSAEPISWIPLSLACALALGMFAAQDAIVGEFANGDGKKIEMFHEALPLMAQFPLTGVGRGAFASAFPLVSDWAARVTFTHAENAVVQLIVDWGIPVGLFALAVPLYLIGRRLQRMPRRGVTAGVIAALVACGLHNLVDFNLEIPGVAVVAVALFAVVAASTERRGPAGHPFRRLPRAVLVVAAVAALALAGLLFTTVSGHTAEEEGRAARQALIAGDEEYFSADRLQAAFSRHPADWYLPFIAGVHAFQRSGVNPLPLLGRASALNPSAGGPHLYIGRFLLLRGYLEQGMLEMRLASMGDARLADDAAAFLVATGAGFGMLSTMARTDAEKRLIYEQLSRELEKQGRGKDARQADRALLKLSPPVATAVIREARRLAVEGDVIGALALARRLASEKETSLAGIQLRATILGMAGRLEEAIATLESAAEAAGNDVGYHRQLALACQEAGLHDRAVARARHLRSFAADVKESAAAVELEGDLERKNGDRHTAVSRYRQASAMVPDNARLLEKLFFTAKEAGDRNSAIDAAGRLQQLQPTDSRWPQALLELGKKVLPDDM